MNEVKMSLYEMTIKWKRPTTALPTTVTVLRFDVLKAPFAADTQLDTIRRDWLVVNEDRVGTKTT